MKELLRTIPQTGSLRWIGRSTARLAVIEPLQEVELVAGQGVDGDHHGKLGSRRQVSLIQAEHLETIARLMPAGGDTNGKATITPERCRRNLVIAGINLISLKDMRFRIGDAILEGSGPCPPCSRMERELGPGGYQAMRGHGGITARVIESASIRIGDSVVAIGPIDVSSGTP